MLCNAGYWGGVEDKKGGCTALSGPFKRHDHSVHMSSVLQVQQPYTAGIPLLEAYLLPMANNSKNMNSSKREQNGR